MNLRTRTSNPRKGDKVWDQRRKLPEKQPNGKVWVVNYEDKTVTVRFFDEKQNGDEFEDYSFDELRDSWTDSLGGSYILEE